MSEFSRHSEHILEAAVASGEFADCMAAADEAMRLLEEELRRRRAEKPNGLSADEWCRRFQAWVDSHDPVGHFVDVSRDNFSSGAIG